MPNSDSNDNVTANNNTAKHNDESQNYVCDCDLQFHGMEEHVEELQRVEELFHENTTEIVVQLTRRRQKLTTFTVDWKTNMNILIIPSSKLFDRRGIKRIKKSFMLFCQLHQLSTALAIVF